MISAPPEFRELCRQFQLASLAYHDSVEAMIASSLSKLGGQRKLIKEFLSDLLSGKYGNEEISAAWNSSDADFFIQGDEGLISFLRLIEERL